MKKYSFLLLVSIIISCNENSTEPELIDTGSRNYSWSSDTIHVDPFGSFRQIWGINPDNIWAIGDAGIWHFDGNKWLKTPDIRYLNLDCIYGSNKDDIWTFASGNYNGANILHFDGNNWTDLGLYSFTTTDGFLGISDIEGSSSNEIYAVGIFMFGKGGGGRKGVIMHYNGDTWRFLDTKELKTNLFNICYDKFKKKYYIEGYEETWDTTGDIPINTENIKKIYEFNGEQLEEIYSEDGTYKNAYSLNGEVYFMNEKKIWTYSNNSFQLFRDFSEEPYVLYNLDGRSEKDIIIHSAERYSNNSSNYLIHYNGTDIQPIYQCEKIRQYCVMEEDIFVIGIDNQGNWISSHGKLKN